MIRKSVSLPEIIIQSTRWRLPKGSPVVFRDLLSEKWLLTLAILLLFLVNVAQSFAETSLNIPSECGEVIYQHRGKGPNQLFIIGIGHRDVFTLLNGRNTSKVQVEVYRIGDWFIHNQGAALLLPEGFFKNKKAKVEKEILKSKSEKSTCTELSDINVLEERLADNRTYVNAEMLLKEGHRLRTEQVEDEELYGAVCKGIFELDRKTNSHDFFLLKSELDYLQEKRTASMLQRIPEVIDEDFRQGNIESRKAIFTIGISHIPGIIKYLSENRITIYSPPFTSKKNKGYTAELNLAREGYAVSIVIPRTLMDDQKTLETNGLGKIVSQFRRQTSIPSSVVASPQLP